MTGLETMLVTLLSILPPMVVAIRKIMAVEVKVQDVHVLVNSQKEALVEEIKDLKLQILRLQKESTVKKDDSVKVPS